MSDDDQLISIFEDVPEVPASALQKAWRVLIVDDDTEVHSATAFVLRNFTYQGLGVDMQHAYSAAEARRILGTDPAFAVILLDVVMETEDAGLKMVRHIREELGMAEVRIILRTGQPGYAMELEVFTGYDINDYRTKSELTQVRLFTAMISALRSYEQIRSIAENRRGLEKIVHASADLMELHAVGSFAEGVLIQLSGLLRVPMHGIVCAQRGSPVDGSDPDGLYVIGATGPHRDWLALPLARLEQPRIVDAIEQAVAGKEHYYGDGCTVIYIRGGESEGAVYVETVNALQETDRQLLEVFAANISSCYSNVKLVERLNYVAYHDGLTHLPNRSQFIVELDDVASAGEQVVVALVDLRHFADLNDGLGHDVGNKLLKAVAIRLREELGGVCRIARVGADVFGVVGPESQVNPDRLDRVFERPLAVGEHALPVSINLGLCRVLGDERSGLVLLKGANIALNRAKRSLYDNYQYFVPEMEDRSRWRLEIINRLRGDFRSGKLAVWFQPKVALTGGACVGVEALLRWPGEGGGFIQPPDVFIPLAEYSGVIVEIGRWVLEESSRAYAQLRRESEGEVSVAVNVSMPQFLTAGFVQEVREIMARHALPPGALELEITESVAMEEPKAVIGSLAALREAGARVAIDDFGTGYSSLAQLHELPIDCLKIDRAFIKDIAAGKGGMFAETIVALGSKLGLTIVAEGVETEEQAGFLRGLGCKVAQGFLYGSPMPLPQLLNWLRQRRQAS
ncbi:EAL domain-containing protein [uncultured Dechloromonas sp.]|uniref:putative bifunctional diguanylate cyclase/phosphodiesterase n=1 Tax=uncultured Dechloromonas sp. TaxID=171719 RepID=UPI0025EE6976|nr:EAL domain-containing protein [uncultured Dechloromonas sp.]